MNDLLDKTTTLNFIISSLLILLLLSGVFLSMAGTLLKTLLKGMLGSLSFLLWAKDKLFYTLKWQSRSPPMPHVEIGWMSEISAINPAIKRQIKWFVGLLTSIAKNKLLVGLFVRCLSNLSKHTPTDTPTETTEAQDEKHSETSVKPALTLVPEKRVGIPLTRIKIAAKGKSAKSDRFISAIKHRKVKKSRP